MSNIKRNQKVRKFEEMDESMQQLIRSAGSLNDENEGRNQKVRKFEETDESMQQSLRADGSLKSKSKTIEIENTIDETAESKKINIKITVYA